MCKRERCRASQRLVEGRWVSNASFYRFHDPVVEYGNKQHQPRQISMWTENTGQPYPLERSTRAMTVTSRQVATPPGTTASEAPTTAASRSASNSPSWGPPIQKIMVMDDMRPRIASTLLTHPYILTILYKTTVQYSTIYGRVSKTHSSCI